MLDCSTGTFEPLRSPLGLLGWAQTRGGILLPDMDTSTSPSLQGLNPYLPDRMEKTPGFRTNRFHKVKEHRSMANFWIANHCLFSPTSLLLAWHGHLYPSTSQVNRRYVKFGWLYLKDCESSLSINNSRQLRHRTTTRRTDVSFIWTIQTVVSVIVYYEKLYVAVHFGI